METILTLIVIAFGMALVVYAQNKNIRQLREHATQTMEEENAYARESHKKYTEEIASVVIGIVCLLWAGLFLGTPGHDSEVLFMFIFGVVCLIYTAYLFTTREVRGKKTETGFHANKSLYTLQKGVSSFTLFAVLGIDVLRRVLGLNFEVVLAIDLLIGISAIVFFHIRKSQIKS